MVTATDLRASVSKSDRGPEMGHRITDEEFMSKLAAFFVPFRGKKTANGEGVTR